MHLAQVHDQSKAWAPFTMDDCRIPAITAPEKAKRAKAAAEAAKEKKEAA
jgi:hypothetical protein